MDPMLYIPNPEPSSLVLVRAREPYITWARSVYDDDAGLEDLLGEPSAYIVPEVDDADDLILCRGEWYQQVFHIELENWTHRANAWPQDRSWAVFNKWFKWELWPSITDARLAEPPPSIQLLSGYTVDTDQENWLEHLFNAIFGEGMRTAQDNPRLSDLGFVAVWRQCELDLAYVSGQLMGKGGMTTAFLLDEFGVHWDYLKEQIDGPDDDG